jgi:flagellar basal-body rod protein FlgC
MGLFTGIEISASGLTAERARMNVIAENLANANSTRGADGLPYQRKAVILESRPLQSFASVLDTARAAVSRPGAGQGAPPAGGVQVSAVVPDGAPGRRVYDPEHPDADRQGFVTLPNVNPVTEMVDLISASRSYEANATALQTSKQMFQRTFDILR